MKRLFIALWFLVPVMLVLFHLRSGNRWLERDRIQSVIRQASLAETRKDLAMAADLFAEAADALRAEDPAAAQQLDLRKARTEANQGKIGNSIKTIERIFRDPTYQQQAKAFQQDVNEAAGRVRYYAAWRMRLENAPRRDWMAQADCARRHFRLLAESRLGDASQEFTTGQMKNLEAAVRLQRMGLDELKAKFPRAGIPTAGPGGNSPIPAPGKKQDPGKAGEKDSPSRSSGGSTEDAKAKGAKGNKGMRDAPPSEGKGS